MLAVTFVYKSGVVSDWLVDWSSFIGLALFGSDVELLAVRFNWTVVFVTIVEPSSNVPLTY